MTAWVAVLVSFCLVPFIGQAGNSPPRILYDKQPLPRDNNNGIASFATIIKKVAPAVLTESATKTVRESSSRPFLDDPMLRRFFDSDDDPPLRGRSRKGDRDQE